MKQYIFSDLEQNKTHCNIMDYRKAVHRREAIHGREPAALCNSAQSFSAHRPAGLRLFALAAVLLMTWMMILFSARPAFAETAGKVKLSKTRLTLVQYRKRRLKLKNAKGTIKWKSSNKKVATVSSRGLVRAKRAGTCKIIAKFQNKKYVCKVTVKPLALTPESLTLDKDKKVMLILNNDDIEATWTSSDPKVATVDQHGYLETKGYGTCDIIASYKGSKAVCRLKVSNSQEISLVLAGSSSMDNWDEKKYAGDYTSDQAFLPCKSTNTAIGGTTVTQWINWVGGAQDKIVKYSPNAVVLYVGSNDLGNGDTGITGDKNAENTITLLKKIRQSLPQAVIFYVGVNPCWSRDKAWNAIAVSNSKMKQYCESQSNMVYIDIASAFKRADGKPNDALFADRLHPNPAGYAVWKQVVAGTVKKVMGVG